MDKPRDEKFLKDHGLTSWGGWNDPPAPCVEVDVSKFWRQFASYGIPEDQEYRQLHIEGKCHSVHILIYYDVILMLESRYTVGGYFPTCWIIGCDHDYVTVDLGSCQHKLTCKKCGYVTHTDSSD